MKPAQLLLTLLAGAFLAVGLVYLLTEPEPPHAPDSLY